MALKIAKKKDTKPLEKWVRYDEDIEFLLRGIDDQMYQVGLERARRLVAKGDSGQTLGSIEARPEDALEVDVQARLVGWYIIRGWRGDILNEVGEKVEYSPQVATDLLKGNTGLFAWVLGQAIAMTAERKAEIEDSVKKPSTATDGKSNATD